MEKTQLDNCIACGGEVTISLREVRDPDSLDAFTIGRCANCGLGKTEPVPQDLGVYYSDQYYGNRHGFTQNLCNRRRLRWIESQRPDHNQRRLLDIGCGDGSFLQLARQANWEAFGVERSPQSARMAGLEVFESIAQVSGTFDCITLWHVLEHLENPEEFLCAIRRLLSDNGTLFIAVPDFGSLQAKLFGKHWLHLDVPRHLFHFTQRSIAHMFDRHGIAAQRMRASELEYDLMGWVQSGLNCVYRHPNQLLKILMGRKIELNFISRAIHLALGVASSLLAFVPTAITGYLGRGGTLVIVAKRNQNTA